MDLPCKQSRGIIALDQQELGGVEGLSENEKGGDVGSKEDEESCGAEEALEYGGEVERMRECWRDEIDDIGAACAGKQRG